MIHRLGQRAKAYGWHLSLIGLFVGLLWAGIGFSLWHDHRAAEREAANDTANLARTFDEDITRSVEAVDQTLLFTREAYRHDPTGFLAGSWANVHAFRDDLHVQISLVNRDGDVEWSNLGPVPAGINIADRPHFLAMKASRGDELSISAPVLGRVSKKWSIQFSRKLLTPDGSFGGMAVVSLDPSYLSRFYQSISIGDGAILLATTDGTILVRAPGHLSPNDDTLPPDTKIRLMHGTTIDAYRTVSSIDHVERIFSSRRLDRYPLVVAVGLATKDVFAAYDRSQRLYIGVGAVLSIVCIAVGIVVIRQRQSLLHSRQALSATLDNISQGITMVRADGSIPVLNRQAIQLLDLPPDLLARRPTLQQIIDWQHANREFGEPETRAAPLERVVQHTGGPFSDYTYERTRPNGTVLEVRTQSLPDGAMVRTFTDVSDRKRNEAALVAAQARAAHAERVQALGQLAGGIAHDFNNILQAVQGGATLIEKRAGDPVSVRRFAGMILGATERGISITRRLLAFARRGELRAEPLDSADLLTGLRDVLSHTLGSGIAVDVLVAAGLPRLLADKGQLETTLVNLATNARDAMPDGGTLTFAASVDVVAENVRHPADLDAGRYVRLSVADTGSGIPEPLLARVLEPFFSTKPAGQGTGLGLSMAKGFAEQSGGGLTIDSAPGRGTTICLWFPEATRTDVADKPAEPSKGARDEASRRVLLVDDEAMVRETLAASLEDAGYIVSTAADGSQALDVLLSSTAVDILVTDLSMPGIDGLAVIQKARCQRPGLPAVLLTGHAESAAEGTASGSYTLIRKPVTGLQLAAAIEALLVVTLTD
ncbi:PAS-domain containing protein [Acidisphaera sp. S103]|uniref:PAS-domain containing protein n=1 Tax=Acidisphaera sp. S103 TaxID=1747223 RepID=UPI00131BF760|nr:PAS-domain containing protein [Acidisphaera sp. S103]